MKVTFTVNVDGSSLSRDYVFDEAPQVLELGHITGDMLASAIEYKKEPSF